MSEIHKIQFNNRTLRYPGYTGYLSFVDSTPTPAGKEVLLYDNNTYIAQDNTVQVISDLEAITISRRYAVVMYDIAAQGRLLYGVYRTTLQISNVGEGVWQSMYYGRRTNIAIPLYEAVDSRTYSAESNVGVLIGTYNGNNYYYLNNNSDYWPYFNHTDANNTNYCTIKFVIDYNNTTGNVRQYVNDADHNRTLIGTGSLSGNSTYNLKLSTQTTRSDIWLAMKNITVAQFDNEADALAYDGEQTV